MLFPVYSMSLHSRCGEYMTTGSRPLEQQQGRWTDGMCMTVCEYGHPCVGQKGCKVIPYITRMPAMLHNTHNGGTLTFSLKACLSFRYLSFPPFYPTPVTLTFWQSFSQHYVCLVPCLKDPEVPCMTSFPALNFPGVQSGMWAKNSNRKFLDWTCQWDWAGIIVKLIDTQKREELESIWLIYKVMFKCCLCRCFWSKWIWQLYYIKSTDKGQGRDQSLFVL